MSDPLNRNVDEDAMVNSLGSILTFLKGGMGDAGGAVATAASGTNTGVGPVAGLDTLSQIQQGNATQKAKPDLNLAALAGFNNAQPDMGAAGNEANPVASGNEPINQGYGGDGGHPGVDIGVPVGTTLVAAIGGKVTAAGNTDPGGYGNEVEITGANGVSVRYGHLSYVGIKVGDTVRAGQLIGKSGGIAHAPGSGNSTGPHLHFEVRQGGHSIDPMHYLSIKGNGVVAGTPGDAAPVDAAPGRTVAPQDAVDTSVGRLTGLLSGKGDPGSENTITPDSTQPTSPQGASGSTADNDPKAIGAFLAATRQHESGGNYQIYNQSGQSNASGAYQFLGSTWKSMGGSTANAAQASPAEQDAIATKMATALFNQFHSWRLVAIAWYGGPGVAAQVAAGKDPGSPSGQGGYLAYGDTIAKMMAGSK